MKEQPMDPLMYDVPDELMTERLRLRVPRAGDGALVFPAVKASIVELQKWMPWATPEYAETDAELWCRRSFVDFHARKSAQMLMLLGDRHLGNLGAFDLKLDVRSCEIGYWLRTDETGRGYMTEAVSALSIFLMKHLKVHRIQIKCDVRNDASAAVAKRCGYQFEGTLRHDALDSSAAHRDTHVFSRLFD
jgi:RimJ/RimL family protein N-acetyltransferase